MGKHSPLKEDAVGIPVRKQFFSINDGKLEWFEGVVVKYTPARGCVKCAANGPLMLAQQQVCCARVRIMIYNYCLVLHQPPRYHVQYSDGDSEELKWQELKKFVVPRGGKCTGKQVHRMQWCTTS